VSSELNNKVYIVTGGSRGFGLAIAKNLVARGSRVGLVSRNQGSLDQAVAEIGSDHAFGVAGDITRVEDIGKAFHAIRQHFGVLDGLVNNAGMARPNAVEHLVESEVLIQVKTNFLGTVFCCQAAIPLLRGTDNPRIVNISSASAHHYDEMSHLSIYAASKAAVERFTRDLRVELQEDGVGVTCIRPGGAWTSFAEGWDADALQAGMDAWKHAGTYMDTGMEVEQVGDAVAYALGQPPGVAVDLLEIRPNVRTPKGTY
jgi:NAD(P)-dependent dehydrogenase (short-subunit alcohol dehydrogenase family)